MKHLSKIIFVFSIVIFSGCSTLTEPFKLVLGISTKALQEARVDAEKASYYCSYQQCFDAVLGLSGKQNPSKASKEEMREVDITAASDVGPGEEPEPKMQTIKYFDVFRKSEKKGFIIVMGIRGQVDTTEAGIFFTFDNDRQTSIDISSLSTPAKRKVAKAVFDALDERFRKVE